MGRFIEQSQELAGQDLTFLGGAPYVYHCHHFNLFHDQTVEDALGDEAASRLKARAAREASYQLLRGLVDSLGARTAAERLEIASSVFPWMGHGRLGFDLSPGGGTVRGETLHYGLAWLEKYGEKVRRNEPIDSFAAGFGAAAGEVAFAKDPGSFEGVETECVIQRKPACHFKVSPVEGDAPSQPSPVTPESAASEAVRDPFTGQDEERIREIATGLKGFVAGSEGDERGLVSAFGVYVTRHLASYYNATAYEAIHAIEKQSPASLPVVESLFGESGHVCVFYTFGNILLSPEWEGMVGPLSGEVEDTVSFCCAIARGLGFGHWTIQELVPGQRLVLRCSSNYEAPYYLRRYGTSSRPRSYFFANAARAFMQLAHRIDWKAKPQLDEALYSSLFRSGLQWKIEQTHCLTKGDPYGEVVVEKVG